VFLSSGGSIYGNASQIPTPETASPDPISPYAASKMAIERVFANYKREYGLDYVAIRAANPYGPFQLGKKKQGIIGSALIAGLQQRPFEIWGDGSIVRDFIYVEDLVEGIVKASVSDNEFSEFNLGSGTGVSINEILDLCDGVLEKPIQRIYKAARSSDVQKSVLDVTRARTHLDWKPKTELVQGIAQTKAWLEENPSLWN
jgi:UDP-glucose 4-epimerase